MIPTIFEAILFLAITMPLVINKVQQDALHAQDVAAEAQGVRLAQYNNAVASWLVAQEEYTNRHGTAFPVGTYTGTAWLKPSTNCPAGQAAAVYLPCGWSDWWTAYFSDPPTTVVSLDMATGRAKAETNLGAPLKGRNLMGPFGGLMVETARAQGASVTQNGQLLVGITSYTFDDTTNWWVTATADLTVQRDPWLRIDGANGMAANLDMGRNDLVNGGNATFSGNVNANNVYATTEVTAANGNAQLSNALHNATLILGGNNALTGEGGELVAKPTCPAGKVPDVFMVPSGIQSQTGIESTQIVLYDAGDAWGATIYGQDQNRQRQVLSGEVFAAPYCR